MEALWRRYTARLECSHVAAPEEAPNPDKNPMSDISSTSPLPLSKIKRPEDWINLQRIITPAAPQPKPAEDVQDSTRTEEQSTAHQKQSLHDIIA